MIKNGIFILVAVFALICIISSCSNSEAEKIDIRGEITDIIFDNDKNVTSILVEGKKEIDTYYDKASVRINEDTTIFDKKSNSEIDISKLKKSDKVEVIFDGEVAESYPVQATAKKIYLIP
jgi:beta-N-acetylhexosaminidase